MEVVRSQDSLMDGPPGDRNEDRLPFQVQQCVCTLEPTAKYRHFFRERLDLKNSSIREQLNHNIHFVREHLK